MIGGILPFLMQWLALSHLGNVLLNPDPLSLSFSPSHTMHMNYQPKSQWALLQEFVTIPEDEIEKFLPQIANILLEYENYFTDPRLIEQYESIILNKCANCLPFGIKVSSLLKAASQTPSESLLRNLFPLSSSASQDRQDRLRKFQAKVETATSFGANLSPHESRLRCEYYRDMVFMMDSLARLGNELKRYPHVERNNHLRVALSQLNTLLHRRMTNKGTSDPNMHTDTYSESNYEVNSYATDPYFHSPDMYQSQQSYQSKPSVHYSAQYAYKSSNHIIPSSSQVATTLDYSVDSYSHYQNDYYSQYSFHDLKNVLPQASCYSLHFPLQKCQDKAMKILRFVESECEVMPSRDKSPYLVIAELLEQPYSCRSTELFAPIENHQVLNQETKPQLTYTATVDNTNESKVEEMESNSAKGATTIKEETPDNSEASGDMIDTFSRVDSIIASLDDQPAPLRPDQYTGPSSSYAHHQYQNSPRFFRSTDNLAQIRGGSSWFGSPNRNKNDYQQNYRYDGSYDGGYNQNQVDSRNLAQYDNSYGSPGAMQENSRYSGSQSFQNEPINATPTPRISFRKIHTWSEKKDMIRSMSPFGKLPGWTMKSFLVKSGDDLRKEQLAMQLIEYLQDIFHLEGIDVHLRPYQIISTGYQAGFVEFLNGARSIDRIKKAASSMPSTLKDYFDFNFGPSYSLFHSTAVDNFAKSLAGYSLITYCLQVKDRHNANILMDPEGNMIHIDYGFILGDSPGFNINFENAPFKLTKEYIEVMGGIDSYAFKLFEDLFVRGFFAMQKHIDGLIAIIQLFYGDQRRTAVDALKSRLLFATTQADVISLIRDSLESWRTKQYDMFQQKSNNIYM